jgi:hypothetical protein
MNNEKRNFCEAKIQILIINHSSLIIVSLL